MVLFQIYKTTLRILQYAADKNIHPEKAAHILGEEMSLENNPQFPGRTQRIIQGLADTGWHQGKDFWKNRRSLVGDTLV